MGKALRRHSNRSMDHSPKQYGRLPSWPAFEGVVANLKRAELAVYHVLVAHCRGGRATVGITRIAKLAGMTERSAKRSVGTLQSRGLIRIETGGGRGRCNTYTIVANRDTDVTVSAAKRVTPARRNGDTGRPERVTHGAPIEQSIEQKENRHPLIEAVERRWPSTVEANPMFWVNLAKRVEDPRSDLSLRRARRMIRDAESVDAFIAQVEGKEVRSVGA